MSAGARSAPVDQIVRPSQFPRADFLALPFGPSAAPVSGTVLDDKDHGQCRCRRRVLEQGLQPGWEPEQGTEENSHHDDRDHTVRKRGPGFAAKKNRSRPQDRVPATQLTVTPPARPPLRCRCWLSPFGHRHLPQLGSPSQRRRLTVLGGREPGCTIVRSTVSLRRSRRGEKKSGRGDSFVVVAGIG